MNNINEKLVGKAEEFVRQFLKENLSDKITFHTLEHTTYVVEKAEYIGEKNGLNPEEIILVKIAAWFHDIGYAVDIENHEKIGAEKADEFLTSQGIEKSKIDQVKECIFATRISTQPVSLLEKVVCDADLSHLAEEDYFERIEKMRKEWKNHSFDKVSKRKFLGKSEEFFETHSYHTDFAKKVFEPKKDANLQKIKKLKYMLDQKKEKILLSKSKKG